MKINEIIAQDVECTPGAIHVPFSDLINNPKKYPGIVNKPNTRSDDRQSDPDYLLW